MFGRFFLVQRVITPMSTSVRGLKEIRVTEAGNKMMVEGVKVKSPREGKLAVPPKEAKKDACPLCRLGLKGLNYTDVLILNQFVQTDHKLMPIHQTGLCGKKYYLVKKLVETAQKHKLLPRPADYPSFGLWDQLNSYHDWPPRKRDQPMKVIKQEYWK